jgi:glucose-6-phosphate 1-dehydrogenase
VALRFGNAIFEPLWNRNHIDHVQITVAEDIGVEGRGKFYEEAGTTRDIVQNHLLQLLMVMAMEPPVAFTADEVRDEKVKVLRALKPIAARTSTASRARAVRAGQLRRQARPGYRQEPNVSPTSRSRRSSRCASRSTTGASPGVPIYIRAGKRLTKRVTEISVHFKEVPHALLAQQGSRPSIPTCWPSASSRTRASVCASSPRCPGRR